MERPTIIGVGLFRAIKNKSPSAFLETQEILNKVNATEVNVI